MLRSTGLITLIGVDNQVDQNKYSPSVAVTLDLGGLGSGFFIRGVRLVAQETGDGAIIKSVGDLIFFNADPAIASNDAAITSAEWATVVGHITVVAATHYGTGDAAGAVAIINTTIPVAASTLWVALYKTDAAAVNDAAGNDETLKIEIFYSDQG